MSLEEIEQQYFTREPIQKLFPEVKRLYEQSQPDTDERARAAYLMGLYYEYLVYDEYQPTERATAAGYYAEAGRIASKAGNKRLISDLLHVEAWEAWIAGDLEKVNMLEERALVLAQEAGHSFGIANSYYRLGMVATHSGLSEVGVAYVDQSLRLSREHGLWKQQMRSSMLLSEICRGSHELSTSRFHLLEALRLARELSLQTKIPELTLHLATLALERKEYEEVTQLVAIVRETVPKEGHMLWSHSHRLTAAVDVALGRYKQAEAEFRTALSLADFPFAEPARADIHIGFADLYLTIHKPARALEEALAALADAEKTLDMGNRKEALSRIHLAYRDLGDYKHAHEYLERSNTLIAESDAQLLKSRLEYHALKNDFEEEKLKSESQTKESELLRVRLEYKERELAERVRHMVKQAETLKQFRNDLRALLRRMPADDPAAKEIRARLAAFREEEINWQEFEQEFAEAHPDFLPTLTSRFPDLTNMERRVAAMVQMQLTSSEIAQLFCITERAVEFHRLNLRKKLHLASGETLPTFLGQLK